MKLFSKMLGKKSASSGGATVRIEGDYLPRARQLGVASILCGAYRIAADVGRVPIKIQKKQAGSEVLLPSDSNALELLTRRPNELQTPMEFIEAMTLRAVLHGEAQAFIERDAGGKPIALWPDLKGGIIRRLDEDRRPFYAGSVEGYGRIDGISRADILEIGQPFCSITSRFSATSELQECISLAQQFQTRHIMDTRPRSIRGLIGFSVGVSSDVAEKVRAALAEALPNVPILDSGAEYISVQPNAADMQFLQSRRFMIEEAARALGVHPLMLFHDGAGQSLTRIQDVQDFHLNFTISPWLERWEQAILFSLAGPEDQVSHDTYKLFKMNPMDLAEYLARAGGSGGGQVWMTENEQRKFAGLNPLTEEELNGIRKKIPGGSPLDR